MIAGPAQRFTSYDLDSNLGLLNITKTKDTGVYNNVANQLKQTSSEVQSFLASATQGITPDLSSVLETRDNLVRQTRDVFSSIKDLTGLSQREIQTEIASFMPDPVTRSAFENLSNQCKRRAQGLNPNFKKPKDKASCGKGGSCSSSQVSGLLNKATGGLIGLIGKTFSEILKTLTALATLGFDANMCKIFGELIKGLDNNTVQKGAAFLLANQGLKGNTTAVLDIASSMGTGRTGIVPSLEIPGLVGMAVSNFTKPNSYSDKLAGGWMDGYDTAMEEIQPGWRASDEDGIPSIANVCSKKNNEYLDMAETAAANRDFGFEDYDTPVAYDEDAFAGTYSAWNGVDNNRSSDAAFFA